MNDLKAKIKSSKNITSDINSLSEDEIRIRNEYYKKIVKYIYETVSDYLPYKTIKEYYMEHCSEDRFMTCDGQAEYAIKGVVTRMKLLESSLSDHSFNYMASELKLLTDINSFLDDVKQTFNCMVSNSFIYGKQFFIRGRYECEKYDNLVRNDYMDREEEPVIPYKTEILEQAYEILPEKKKNFYTEKKEYNDTKENTYQVEYEQMNLFDII